MSKKDKTEDIETNVEETTNEATQTEEELSVEDQLKEELGKEKDKFLRLFAEFENYKRRTNKERAELFKTAGQDVILSLLPVMDDFDRAIHEISKSQEGELLTGVELIRNKLKTALSSKGLEDIVVEVGEVFNADEHDAVTQIPAPSEDLKGKIVDVIEKGYKMGDRVIRYPKVITGF
ncbi:nucleotide exchange factor GrpE [Gelidibacter maritimus]|uniref:Protein GrpE n=1 Tax=Gelidibacter maritimus TaxID=2761487 RepID=A0A7W2R3T7_9FLAO|nr:nucleotide exchange factor GrpE [Gelidibacter maritimus]MBA6152998.1 nucleotide exchange factor GrpE [Gelidibacter maritimus]